jgi:hypothetical protein
MAHKSPETLSSLSNDKQHFERELFVDARDDEENVHEEEKGEKRKGRRFNIVFNKPYKKCSELSLPIQRQENESA